MLNNSLATVGPVAADIAPAQAASSALAAAYTDQISKVALANSAVETEKIEFEEARTTGKQKGEMSLRRGKAVSQF